MPGDEMSVLIAGAVTQCRFQLGAARAIMAGLDDSHRALEPQPGTKTAGWLIGHLSATGDYGRKICGRPALCPKEWRAKFNPGTQPSHDPAHYPPLAELVDTFRLVYADFMEGALQLDAAALASPNPFTPALAAFPTAGDFAAYLMTGHLGYHLGQLHAWRAAAGVPRKA